MILVQVFEILNRLKNLSKKYYYLGIIISLLLLVLVRMGLFMFQKVFLDIDMEVWWIYIIICVNSMVIDVNWMWGVVLVVDMFIDFFLYKVDLDFMVS